VHPESVALMQDIWQLLDQTNGALAALQIDLSTAKVRYPSVKAESEASVHRWEWSSSLPRYELDPLYFLDRSARRGKATNKQPQVIRNKHQYGLDSSGRVVVERDHTELAGKFYERFYRYGDAEISAVLYDYSDSKDPINCSRLTLERGVPASLHQRAQYGAESHIYVPRDGLIQRFCSLHMPDGREPFGGDGELVFRGDSTVEVWHRQPDGSRELSFSGASSLYNTLASIHRGATASSGPMRLPRSP